MKTIARLYVVLILLALASCRTAIQTVAPEEKYEQVHFSPQESSFSIPLQFSIQEMQALVNKHTEGVLYEDKNMEDDNFMVKVSKHSPITLSITGNEVQFRVPLNVWLKGGVNGKTLGISWGDFEEVNGALALTFRTKVDLDPFWNIKTQTRFVTYEWIEQPQFSIALLNIPFKILAGRLIKSQQEVLAALIDDQVRQYVDTRSYIESAWSSMHEPISLSTDPPTWLSIKPKDVFLSPLTSDSKQLYLTVGLKAITETVVGKKPVVAKTNLPNYKTVSSSDGSYRLQLGINIAYEQINDMASKYLVGQVYTFSEGKKKITINAVSFYGKEEQMVAEVLLSGSINGKVYLKGYPVYDSIARKVVFSKLDFDLDTKNKLHQSASWLVHDVMVKKMAPYFSYYIGDYLDKASLQVKENLKHKQLHQNLMAEGSLEELKPVDIVLTREGLIALVNAKGKIKLFVTGLDKY